MNSYPPRKFGYETQVMGASFRKIDQIIRLAGCDRLTISPDLLEQTENTPGEVTRRLSVEMAESPDATEILLEARPSADCTTRGIMAVEKLSDVCKLFADARKVEQFAQANMAQRMAG